MTYFSNQRSNRGLAAAGQTSVTMSADRVQALVGAG